MTQLVKFRFCAASFMKTGLIICQPVKPIATTKVLQFPFFRLRDRIQDRLPGKHGIRHGIRDRRPEGSGEREGGRDRHPEGPGEREGGRDRGPLGPGVRGLDQVLGGAGGWRPW